MKKKLIFVRAENVKSYDDQGQLASSEERQYFKYICHAPDAECQLVPEVCRIKENVNSYDEPRWTVDENVCKRCSKTDGRLLEDVFNAA